LSNLVIMERLSKEYGWTPDEIRRMNVDDIQGYVDIISTRSLLEKAQSIKNRR